MTFAITGIVTTLPNQAVHAYAEVHVDAQADHNSGLWIGVMPSNGGTVSNQASLSQNGTVFPSGAGTGFGTGDVVCLAYSQDSGKLWIRVNGNAWIGGGDPVAGTSPTVSGLGGSQYVGVSEAGSNSAGGVTGRFRTADFTQAVPAGFSGWSGT